MVHPNTLAMVVSKMEAAELYDCKLTRHQLHVLTYTLAEENCKLKELNIGGNYDTADPMLPQVFPDSLSKGVIKLEIVRMEGLNLTVEQIEAILEEVVEKESMVEVLDLSYNIELERADGDLMEQAKRRLKDSFYFTD